MHQITVISAEKVGDACRIDCHVPHGAIGLLPTDLYVLNSLLPKKITVIGRALINYKLGADRRRKLLTIENPGFDLQDLNGAAVGTRADWESQLEESCVKK